MFFGRGKYEGGLMVLLFFESVSIQIMPWVLYDFTSAVLWVIRLVVACWDHWFIANRLLG